MATPVSGRHPTAAARRSARVLMVAIAASVATASGCEVPDAVGYIGGCLAPAIQQVQSGTAAITQECDLMKPATIVAVPSRARADQLALAGVPEWAARLMAGTDIPGDRWCQILTTTEPQNGAPAGGRTICVESSVVLPDIMVLTGTKFNMTLARETQGTHVARLSKVTRIL